MAPDVGQLINNRYRLLKLIGDGGMGSVYEARHEILGTKVALKFLHPELARKPQLVQRFLQEARVVAQIHSQHVVRVSDVDQSSSGLAFIVMEYLEGKTLQALYDERRAAGRKLELEEALDFADQILEGVESAHQAGVVHRDLKPDNVMIVQLNGRPLLKLLDFGIAKLKAEGADPAHRGITRPGVAMGTPEYMAPEQAYSADLADARADVFALGVMIFEMLSGKRPVMGGDPHEIAGRYFSGDVLKLSVIAPYVPTALSDVIHKAILADPAKRFTTMAEFRAALHAAKMAPANSPTPAAPPRPSFERTLAPRESASPLPIESVSGTGDTPPASPMDRVAPPAAAAVIAGATLGAAPVFAEPRMGGTEVPSVGQAPFPAVARTQGEPAPAPALPVAAPPLKTESRRSVLGIVSIAAAVAVIAVGGAFAAQQLLGAPSTEDAPIAPLPLPPQPTAVQAETVPPIAEAPPVIAPPVPPAQRKPPADQKPPSNPPETPPPATTTSKPPPVPTTPPPASTGIKVGDKILIPFPTGGQPPPSKGSTGTGTTSPSPSTKKPTFKIPIPKPKSQ